MRNTEQAPSLSSVLTMVLRKNEFCEYRIDSNSPWIVGTYAGRYMTQYAVTMRIRVSRFIFYSNVIANFRRPVDDVE